VPNSGGGQRAIGQLLLYWVLDGQSEWMLEGTRTLKEFRELP
jgi:hypothetical protein